MTGRYGLVGWPVAASRSPTIQRAAFAALALDATYDLFPVRPGALADAMREHRARGTAGLNVTVPHKVDVLAHLDAVDALARDVGAVNTIVRAEDGTLSGTNTDVGGLLRALREEGIAMAGKSAIVVGSGGAARAALVALVSGSVAAVRVVARDRDRARSVAALRGADATALDDATLGDAFARTALVVHATSAMSDPTTGAALVARLPLGRLPDDAVVVDLAYGTPSALLEAACARQFRVLDGLGMLLHQGALSFELWTGRPAPLEAMRAALSVAP